VFNAIVLNKILYTLTVYFGYLTEGHKDMLRPVLKKAIKWASHSRDMTWTILSKTAQYKLSATQPV